MKKEVIFTQGNKEYKITYTIRSLAELERSIGRSLLFMYASGPAGMVRQCDITFTANALKCGLVDIGDRDPYDVIDEYCENGGILDTLNGHILDAINQTGFFMKAAQAAEPQTAPTLEPTPDHKANK